MIPRSEFAVERCAFEACLAGLLGGLHAALSKSKSGFEALIRYRRRRWASGQGETLSDKLFAHIAPLGWEHISFNGDDVWASEPLKQGFRPYEM